MQSGGPVEQSLPRRKNSLPVCLGNHLGACLPLPHTLKHKLKPRDGMDYESAAHLAPTPSYALESSDGESDYEDELLSRSSRVTRKPAVPPPEVEVTFSGVTDKLKERGEAVFLVGEAGERMAQGVALASSGEEETVSVLVDGEQVRSYGSVRWNISSTDI